MSLFYLIASLPRVTLDDKPMLSLAAFRALCVEQMWGRARLALERLCDQPDYSEGEPVPDHPFVQRWRNREIQIRNAVARLRAGRRNSDATGSLRTHDEFDACIENAVDAAFDQPTPLDRERALDELRWSILDEIQGPAPFADSVVFAYAVKLKLAWRWALLDKATGEKCVHDAVGKAPSNHGDEST